MLLLDRSALPVSQRAPTGRQGRTSVGPRTTLAALVVLLAVACGNGAPEMGRPSPGTTTSPAAPGTARADAPALVFNTARVTVEIADEPEERRVGLMGRTSLDEDAGMLFLFDRPSEGGFWMKNTLIPLSIAYMEAEGEGAFRVLAILDMAPCEADPCPTYAPGTSYGAALEVNQGWFARHGVQVGDVGRLDPA